MLVSDSIVLGTVNACMGVGGIAVEMIVSIKKKDRHKAVAIYVSAALLFLFGDLIFENSPMEYSIKNHSNPLDIEFTLHCMVWMIPNRRRIFKWFRNQENIQL